MKALTFTKNGIKIASIASLLIGSGLTLSAEPEQCKKVTFSDPGWTDIGATNGVATTLLNAMGYDTQVYLLSVPVGFESLKNGKIDAFMGNWMPAQSAFIDKYKGDIDVIRTNLEGVKFTLAVPSYAFNKGVKDFADLSKFSKEFRQRIYGIGAGAPANQKLQSMIDTNDFNLKGWKVVESGEQAMLSQVARSVKRDNFIVFLAWEPHPMNVNFDLKYLSGGDKYFGPNYGGATIHTVTRKGYKEECQNVGTLLSNLEFGLTMENEIIASEEKPEQAAESWIKKHPEVLEKWLQGVTTYAGQPALPAVKKQLGLM
ncbi:choline ABC transporter substrate-binding protein [Marinomonas profundimaris]|uniref:Glycine/betaine ABC transporter substrate-binding protein n=1 Tax=Marinomonas profundimaris TaxID=1208321 RepID=W1RNK9_9GAMM|nr:choline ABC transporter substrate-binding protein [Marinomonas profundimaris]ETI57987.1 glycine/betaine ABC transporter substrate-binding protein [Marinomonas profundimaris]